MQAPGNHPYSHISYPEIITHPQIVPISLNPLYPEEFPTCLHQLYFSCVSAIYNYKCRRIPVIYCGREAHPMNFELSANVIGLWAKDARPHSSPAIPCQCPIQSIEFRLLFIGAWGNPILAQHKFLLLFPESPTSVLLLLLHPQPSLSHTLCTTSCLVLGISGNQFPFLLLTWDHLEKPNTAPRRHWGRN